MFAVKPRFEFVFRILLIAVILFATPGHFPTASAAPQSRDGTPTQSAAETPTAEPTGTPTEPPAPPVTETPIPSTETPAESKPVVPTETPVPAEPVSPVTSQKADQAPLLNLSSNPDFITPGGVFILNWSVEGVDPMGLVLRLILPEGISLNGSDEGKYDEASRSLFLDLAAPDGKIQLRAEEGISDASIKAELLKGDEVIVGATLYLPAHEKFVLGQQGGKLETSDRKIQLDVPAGILPENTVIDIGKPSGDAQPRYSLSGQPFEITAHDGQTEAELKHFSKRLSILVSYADMNVPEQLEGDLRLNWYDPTIEDWVPISSMVNTKTKTLLAFTDHFTVFDLDTNNWQASHLPVVDAFQIAPLTGAATYSYPIEVPPGPGGFQPSLSLTYNSQVVDQSTLTTQASWVGMGWSLEAGSIELDTHGTSAWTGDDSYLLNLGGLSTRIVQDGSGVYHAADEFFLKVNYDSGNNIWTVKDKTGNTYIFGHKSYSRIQLGDCLSGTGVIGWQTYRWSITEQDNIFTQENTPPTEGRILYTYSDQTKSTELWSSTGGCHPEYPTSITATYLETITYANGKYRIRFDHGNAANRWDYPDMWTWDVYFHTFEKNRLQKIYVEQDANLDNVFETTIRHYELEYANDTDPDIIFPGYTATAGGKTSTLRSIEQYGVGVGSEVASLPPVTFSYDNLHLTRADNGYGGVVEYSYGFWYYEDTARESYTIRQNFGSSGFPCGDINPVVPWSPWEPRIMATIGCEGSKLNVRGGIVYAVDMTSAYANVYTGKHSRDLVRPGGKYKLMASINPQGNSVRVGLFDGTTDHLGVLSSNTYILDLPATASKAEPLIESIGAPINPALVSWFQLQLLTSVYRVTEKRVYDNNGHLYTTSYAYTSNGADTGHVNDRLIAPDSTCDFDAVNCFAYSETWSEFRGNEFVTETAPSGIKTVTKFRLDDTLKGRPDYVIVSAGSTLLSRVDYHYSSNPLPIKTYKACETCPAYKGIGRQWNYTDYETTTLYKTGGSSSRRLDYSFESNYGNLISIEDQYLNGSTWTTYRSTSYYFYPRDDGTKYLAALPAKIKLLNGAGAAIATTINLYDGNEQDHQVSPTSGILTAVRTQMLDSGSFNQVSYTYDSWGNRTGVTTYTGYTTWNTNPTSAPRTSTTTYDPVFHVFPISQTTPPPQAGQAALQTRWIYDYDPTIAWDSDGNDYILGVPTKEIDPNGNITTAGYDPFGRIVQLVRPGDGTNSTTIQIAYSDQPSSSRSLPFTTTLTQTGSDAPTYTVKRVYDGLGRLTRIISGGMYTDTLYPSATETRQSFPYNPNSYPPETPRYTITTVDNTTRTTTVSAPDGTSTVTTIDGLTTTVRDANTNNTVSVKDLWGRVVSVTPPAGTGPWQNFTYDELDRIVQVRQTGTGTNIGPGTSSLVSWWSMNEQSGQRNDSFGTNHLTSNNSVSYAAGLNGIAAKILPTYSQRLSRTDNASLSTGDINFTLVANVYLNSTTNTMVIVNKGDQNNQNVRDYTLWVSNGVFGFRVGNGTTTGAVTSGAISANTWYKVIAWHDAVNNTLNIQVNNGPVNTVSYSSGAMDTTFPLSIGAHSNGSYGLDGRIDEVALYKRVLTAVERTWLYNTGLGRTYAELTAPAAATTTFTNLTYDTGGRKTSMSDPAMGYWSYAYDALGNLTSQTDARGCTTSLSYDALNRLTQRTYSNCPSTPAVSYYYDGQPFTFNSTPYTTFTNPLGRRTGMVVSDSSAAKWDYDPGGRMTRETQNITSGGIFTTEWKYNSAGLPVSTTYPDGEVVSYGYNDQMLLQSVKNSSVDYVKSTAYDAAGRITQRVLGNDLTQKYKFYPWTSQGGRLEKTATGSGAWSDENFNFATNIQKLTYAYDANGNVLQISNLDPQNPETNSYTYDAMNRLQSWTKDTQQLYVYDTATGNLVQKEGITLAYNDPAHAHAVSSVGNNSYLYDQNGSQTRRIVGPDTYDLVYDAENRLSQVKKNSTVIATFTYDGDGNRVKSVMGTETTLFIGGQYEVTNPGTQGQTVTKYYFAGATRVAMRKYVVPESMQVEYFLGDHLGSTSITTDSTGAKVSDIRYKPWGEIRSAPVSPPAGTSPAYKLASYTFTGQFSYMDDPNTGPVEGFGLMFYNARMYDPALGRFTSADTVLADPIQGWDRYAYVNNNPIAYTDPSGHRLCGDGEDINCDGTTNTTTPPIDLGTSDNPDQPDIIDVSEQSDPVQKLYALYRWMWDQSHDNWWWKRYGKGGFTLWEFMSIFWGNEQSTYPNSSDYATALGNHAPVYCLSAGCNYHSNVGALQFLADFTHATLPGHSGDCMAANKCQEVFATPPIPSAGESMNIVEGIYLAGPGYPGRHELYDLGNVSMNSKVYKKMIALGMVDIVYGQNGQNKMIILTYCQAQMASYAAGHGGAKAINLRTYHNFCGG